VSSSDSTVATVPATVVVPAASGATFVIETHPVEVDKNVVITLRLSPESVRHVGDAVFTTTLTVLAPVLTSFAFDRLSTHSPEHLTATLTLSGPAPARGLAVSLASQNAAVINVPAVFPMPPGATRMNFVTDVAPVAALTNVEVRATAGAVVKTATIAVDIGVASITFDPDQSHTGGNTITGHVALTGPAPAAGALIGLWFKPTWPCSGCCPAPTAQATVAAGAKEAPFTFQLRPTNRQLYDVSYAGRVLTQFSVIEPQVAALEVPAQIQGGQTATAKIKLTGVIPPVGCTNYYYLVRSNDNSVIRGSGQIVPGAGTSAALFELTTAAVTTNRTIIVSLWRASGGDVGDTGNRATIVVTP